MCVYLHVCISTCVYIYTCVCVMALIGGFKIMYNYYLYNV